MEGQPVIATEECAEFLTGFDLHLFTEGTHLRLYEKLGAHLATQNGVGGTHFGVWAPNAQRVYAMGDFNGWDRGAHPLSQCGHSGVWAGFIPGVQAGAAYGYHIVSWHHGYRVDKTDPMSFRNEGAPRNASFVWDLSYEWQDQEWMGRRGQANRLKAPLAIYEVHLGSWRRVPEEGNRRLTYRELGPRLAEYASQMGFTHVELMPVMEHPLDGPKEYDTTGYFAPASRFGAPQDLMYLIDCLHQRGLGVILDWVPTHFPTDDAGLAYFDGTHLYEHGAWPMHLPTDGRGYRFDYSRREVRSFLLSSACFWLDKYHADGLRLGSVSAMLYLDYGHKPEEWVPNRHGGRENLDGIEFLRRFNEEIYRNYPDVQTLGEETSGWPLVSRPTHAGGLGFGFKWDGRFSQRTIQYFAQDPFFRKFHHSHLVSGVEEASSENLVLPLAHDLVERGHGSLLAKMPGDDWQRLANLRLLLGYQYLQPGKKLVFMGDEFGQWQEWSREASLDWHLTAYPAHGGIQRWVGDLNHTYRTEPALHQADTLPVGFEWVDCQDAERGTLSWLRRDAQRREVMLVAMNLTPVVRRNVRVGVRRAGRWRELLNSDAAIYGGSGQGNFGGVTTAPLGWQGFPCTLSITLPPLAAVVFKYEG